MKRTHWLACAALSCTALLAAPAVAQEDGDAVAEELDEEALDLVRPPTRTPREGTPLINNKLYPMQYRFETSALFDISYANKYVDHYGLHLSLNFHIFDWLSIEGFGGWMSPSETNIAEKVRQAGKSHSQSLDDPSLCANATCEPELPDLWQTTWFAGAHVQWAPIYGKLSFVSELDLSFQLYGMLGGGVEGIHKQLNNGAFENGIGTVAGGRFWGVGTGLRPVASYGVGLRLIPWKWMALRAEFRNSHGLNPGVPERNSQGVDPCEGGYTLQVGADLVCNEPDISTNAMLQIGVSFLL